MCGLCGVLTSQMNAEKEHIFKDLLAMSTVRGWQGAGVAAVPVKHKHQDNKIQLFYHEGTAAELAYRSEFTDWLQKKNSVCLMGHARFPTSGGLGLDDCHPIHHFHIVGTHNGTLTKINGKKVGVQEHDSKLLFEQLNKSGPEIFKNIEGAYSVVYLNKNTERLYFIRNKERPLYMAMVEGDPGTLFWASEAPMLRLAISRRCVSPVHVFQLKPGLLVGYRMYFGGGIDFEQVQVIPEKTSVPVVTQDLSDKGADQGRVYKTVTGSYLTTEEMSTVLKAGCHNCQQPCDLTDFVKGDTVFFSPKEFMCSVCLEYDRNAQNTLISHGFELPRGINRLPMMQ